MIRKIKNLVFEGGGVLGISYLGVLDYLYQNNKMGEVARIAGTSAGAIIASVVSLNLQFEEIVDVAYTLDYKKVMQRNDEDTISWIPEEIRKPLEEAFGDLPCVFRLVNNYGWYSTDYFYTWMQGVIADKFDSSKKKPPYTFADFKDSSLHKDNTPFLDLYIIGTNVSMQRWEVFSYETTPMMEVAEAVRISMSVPFVFEAVKSLQTDNKETHIFCDGGVMNNYPLNLFDRLAYQTEPYYKVNMETLGVRFASKLGYKQITNIIEYTQSLIQIYMSMQEEVYKSNPFNKNRSIIIDNPDVYFLDFNMVSGDEKFQALYHQGYIAAKQFFS